MAAIYDFGALMCGNMHMALRALSRCFFLYITDLGLIGPSEVGLMPHPEQLSLDFCSPPLQESCCAFNQFLVLQA